MTEETTKVICPKCGTKRSLIGTPERVRCPTKDGCGARYYVANNLVPKEVEKRDKNKESGTISGQESNNIMKEIALERQRINIMNTPGRSTLFETFREANPDPIIILFNTLDKSITSVWGPRPNGKNKWDAKYNMWLAFKKWFEGG